MLLKIMNKSIDVTLVIPTYNRHTHLKRLLSYLGFRFENILVLDSSQTDIAEANSKFIEDFNINICHRVFDTGTSPQKKFLVGLESVKTDYVLFCADDDVVFPDGVEAALVFLRNNLTYVGADGVYLNFQRENDHLSVGVEYSLGGSTEHEPLLRVYSLLKNYESLFYGVYRTKPLITVFRHLQSIESYHFGELFQSVAVLLLGRLKRLPLFYLGRQLCDPAELDRTKWQTYYWFADNRSGFIEHYLKYRDALFRFYEENGETKNVDIKKFMQVIDLSHALFFSKKCPEQYFSNVVRQGLVSDAEDSVLDILQIFKSGTRRWIESLFKRLTTLIDLIMTSAFNPFTMILLYWVIRKEFGAGFVLKPRLRTAWLVGSEEFRRAYRELCIYFKI